MKQKPFWSAVFKEHVETLHGIVRLIIVRVAPFRRPLGIFSSTTFIVPAKKNVVWLPLNLPEAYFTCESIFFGSPMLSLTVEGPKVPLSRGLFGFLALRCYAEECAISLSTLLQ